MGLCGLVCACICSKSLHVGVSARQKLSHFAMLSPTRAGFTTTARQWAIFAVHSRQACCHALNINTGPLKLHGELASRGDLHSHPWRVLLSQDALIVISVIPQNAIKQCLSSSEFGSTAMLPLLPHGKLRTRIFNIHGSTNTE